MRRLLAAAVWLAPVGAGAQPAVGDAASGRHVFMQCQGCHARRETAMPGIGPTLAGVVNLRAGSRADFTYSAALAGSGIVWNAASLDRFIAAPGATVPGTRMVFAGIADPKMREDLIAYLATLH